MDYLGYAFEDKITGFAGVCTGYVEYLTGCSQVLLVPRVDKDGKSGDGQWFDVSRVSQKKDKRIVLDKPSIDKNPGCDMAAPIGG